MSEIHFSMPGGDSGTGTLGVSGHSSLITPDIMQKIALALALFTSMISLGLAVCVGLQRAGTLTERVWSVAMSLAAVLWVHLSPMLWRIVPGHARVALMGLWLVALCLVLTGQADLLEFAHQHAADRRAQTVPVVVAPAVVDVPVSRSLTSITQHIATVSVEIAHVDARHCTGDCPGLRARKATLAAQLVALNVEANEAKRRETEEDWIRDQAGRSQESRESRRADPVFSVVARWLGTTEARLSTLYDLACVIGLEGTACFAWYLAGIRPVVTGRTAVVSDLQTTVPRYEPVASVPDMVSDSHAEATIGQPAGIAMNEPVANDAVESMAMSEDDRLVAKIHEAVVAGYLPRNLASIRSFIGCAQSEAVRLNRLYVERFGKARGQAKRGDPGHATA